MGSGGMERGLSAAGVAESPAFTYSVVFAGDGQGLRFEVFKTQGERTRDEIVADLAAAAVRLDAERD